MAIAATVIDVVGARGRITRHLNLTLSGNYSTGGDTLDLTAITNPDWLPAAKAFQQLPSVLAVLNFPDGYGCQVIPGSALNNNLVKVFTAEGAELAAATGIVAEVVSAPNV